MEDDVIMPPVHPGEILLTEFLEPLELSQYQLARSIAVPPRRINEIVHGQRRISADTALRLARFFGTSERFWMNLQSRYDLEIEKDRLGPVLDEIHPLTAASLRRLRLLTSCSIQSVTTLFWVTAGQPLPGLWPGRRTGRGPSAERTGQRR
jgi:antitoxin HigA-1